MGGSEHSDNADVPIVASEYCLDPLVAPQCVLADPVNPLDSFRKWDATLEQARAATTPTFTAFRGFEWTSDRFGHINVYFSRNDANAKVDGGYATMDAFYSWLTRAAVARRRLGRARDLQPPGRASRCGDATPASTGTTSPTCPRPTSAWSASRSSTTTRRDYGQRLCGTPTRSTRAGTWARSAPRTSATGAPTTGAGPTWAKTVILAEDRSEAALKAAMLARRFYAMRTPGIRAHLHRRRPRRWARASRRTEGQRLDGRARRSTTRTAKLELVTSGGEVVASGLGKLSLPAAARVPSERYYFVARRSRRRADRLLEPGLGDGAPRSGPDAASGSPATCTCTPASRTTPTAGRTTTTPGRTSSTRSACTSGAALPRGVRAGLDYLAITDHNDVRSSADPDFGSFGVIGVPGYENSLHGHAQMLGATRALRQRRQLRRGGQRARATRCAPTAASSRPTTRPTASTQPFDACADTGVLDWSTATTCGRTRSRSGTRPARSRSPRRYWECWLERGARVGATGGSDSHWLSTAAGAGRRQPDHVGVRARPHAGRRSSRRSAPGARRSRACHPAQGGGAAAARGRRATATARYESIVGDTVPPGRADAGRPGRRAPASCRCARTARRWWTRCRSRPGGELRFRAPDASAAGCAPRCCCPTPRRRRTRPAASRTAQAISTCAYDQLVAGITLADLPRPLASARSTGPWPTPSSTRRTTASRR